MSKARATLVGRVERMACLRMWRSGAVGGLGSGGEGALVHPGAVANKLAWCGKVTLLTVGLSSDSLWTCAAAGTVVRGIEYAREMAKTRSQTQRLVRAPGRAVSAGHARGEGLTERGGT